MGWKGGRERDHMYLKKELQLIQCYAIVKPRDWKDLLIMTAYDVIRRAYLTKILGEKYAASIDVVRFIFLIR